MFWIRICNKYSSRCPSIFSIIESFNIWTKISFLSIGWIKRFIKYNNAWKTCVGHIYLKLSPCSVLYTVNIHKASPSWKKSFIVSIKSLKIIHCECLIYTHTSKPFTHFLYDVIISPMLHLRSVEALQVPLPVLQKYDWS